MVLFISLLGKGLTQEINGDGGSICWVLSYACSCPSQVQFNSFFFAPVISSCTCNYEESHLLLRLQCAFNQGTGFSDLIALTMKDVILRKLDLQENLICD